MKLVPYTPKAWKSTLESLRGSVVRYDDPTEPVGLDDWESIRSEEEEQGQQERQGEGKS